MKILKTASSGSKFTGSYKKEYLPLSDNGSFQNRNGVRNLPPIVSKSLLL